jgi:YD repeat-containing protein
MADSLLWVAIGVVILTLLMSVPARAFLKFFAPPLTWGQAFIISILCFAISTALVAVYYFVKATTGIASSVDGSATIAILILTGVLITRRARAYGIDKVGWFGVGGKTILALIAFSWVLVGLYMLIDAASAEQQQRTYYDSSGRSLGRSTTDSQGTVTNIDARGKVISREFTTGNTTTIYDAAGRNVGRLTTRR